MIKKWVTVLLAASVSTVAAPGTDAQTLKERITWTFTGQTSQVLTLYDAGSNQLSSRAWNFGGWHLVGTAGNRILWELGVGSQHARMWKITDDGDRVSHVDLTPPAPGYKARSLSLSWVLAGGIPCYRRGDADQSYWILWERDVPNRQIYVQRIKGDGRNELTRLITKPADMGTRAALGLAHYGNDLLVMFAQDATRTSLWTIPRRTMRFNMEWLFITNPTRVVQGGGLFVPASLNAYYDTAPGGDGAMIQILFNEHNAGPFVGRAVIVNVRETNSTPFGRQAFKREIWTHESSNHNAIYSNLNRYEATAHTILPSVCP